MFCARNVFAERAATKKKEINFDQKNRMLEKNGNEYNLYEFMCDNNK